MSTKILNRALNLGSETRTFGSSTINVYEFQGNLVRRAEGTVAATSLDSQAGFTKGAFYTKSDVATGTKSVYENVGTTASSSFNLLGEAVAGDITLAEGNMLVGNSSGVGAAIDGSAGGNVLIGNDTTMVALDGSADTQILVGNATTMTSVALSSDVTMTNAGVVTIANDAVTEAKTADSDGTSGLYVKKTALALYDFATDGGSQGAIVLTDVATLPDNAVCTAVTYDVITTCTSGGGDAATVAITLPTDGALSTAIAISDGTNPWDAGPHLASVITPLAVKTTAARAIGITVAGGQDLTAGKIVFAVDYYVSE